MAKSSDKYRYSDEYGDSRTSNRDKKRMKQEAQMRRSRKRGYDDNEYEQPSRMYRNK